MTIILIISFGFHFYFIRQRLNSGEEEQHPLLKPGLT
jgi:hypothetical protein